MALTQTQKTLVEKTRSVGASNEAEALSDGDCIFLVATIAKNLDLLGEFPELSHEVSDFFDAGFGDRPNLGEFNFLELYERLLALDGDADSFFNCLGMLYKARLKYANILRLQPIPNMDQVGPRGLLQYGTFGVEGLTAFLLWRKWLFDIDNRAGQETGYLFEPIIAGAIGGTPISAAKSPVRRVKNTKKGRQIDCLKDKHAYEIKIRVTIAASGQGRWGEELDYPLDCKNSGYMPVLLVLDPTPNPKLYELRDAFLENGGTVYIGDDAWQHLDDEAGHTMAKFIEIYVRDPISNLLSVVPDVLPQMTLDMANSIFSINIGDQLFTIDRGTSDISDETSDIPPDVDDMLPGS